MEIIIHNTAFVKQRYTPYLIGLMQKNGEKITKQFLPKYHRIKELPEPEWDKDWDFFINHTQNKYNNSRLLVRVAHNCDSLCQFCFESARTLSNDSLWHSKSKDLDETRQYIKDNPSIDEVIFSWWDPMTLWNNALRKYLSKVRQVDESREMPMLIRINTRNMTFNPFRFDKEFARICDEFNVNNIWLHISNSEELTKEVEAVIRMFWKESPFTAFFLNTPLLKWVNDSVESLKTLITKASSIWIKPNYIYHTMPETPSWEVFQVPILDALKIMDKISWIWASSIIRPQFAIVPADWKFLPSIWEWSKNYEIIENWIKYTNRKWEVKEYVDR